MDPPLSVAASISGLLTASIEVIKLFSALKEAYGYAQTVLDEIHHFRFTLFQLHQYVNSQSMNVTRASMIDLDHVVSVLLGCVLTFSELEREAKRLQSRPGALRLVWWVMARSNFVDLVQRLENHKGTMCSMILILTSGSQDEAVNGMHQLRRKVEELVRINAEMAHKLASVSAGFALSSGASIVGASTTGSVMTMRSVLSSSSARTNFSTTFKNSQVYRRVLFERVSKLRPAIRQGSAPSLQQSWSVLSGISLSEVSSYVVYSLPISPQELYNPSWYTTPRLVDILEPSTPEVPASLTTAFAEALKIALKQSDVETAKSIANYIPYWNIVLEMSAAYPLLAADSSNRNSPEEVLDRLTLLRLWLQCGGNADAKNQMGQTGIQKAVVDEDWDLFKLLGENGSDINSACSSGKNALHLVSGLGGEKMVLALCDAKDRAEIERTPVGCSLRRQRGSAVQALLKLGANINAQDLDSGDTALHHSLRSGHWEVVEVLLGHGADIEARGNKGRTALYLASARGNKHIVETLLSHGADVNARDNLYTTSLHRASAGGHTDVVEILVSCGAEVKFQDEGGRTALHYASTRGYKDIVDVLLSCGADVKCPDGYGHTALHRASASGHKDIVDVLLSCGADVKCPDEQRMTALHFASACGYENIVEVLLNHGADTKTQDMWSKTALHYASADGHGDVVKLLLSRGAGVKVRDKRGLTALHYASAGGHEDVVELLLSHGAGVQFQDKRGMTALHYASAGAHEDVVELLLSHGADIKVQDELERTAFNCASARRHRGVIEILVKHRADEKAKKERATALH